LQIDSVKKFATQWLHTISVLSLHYSVKHKHKLSKIAAANQH